MTKEECLTEMHNKINDLHTAMLHVMESRDILWQLGANVSGLRKDNPKKAVEQCIDVVDAECHWLDKTRDEMADIRSFFDRVLNAYEEAGEDWWKELNE